MPAFIEQVFETLFKYRPLIFQRGDFTFASAWSAWLVMGVALLVAAPVIWMYTRARGRSSLLDRGIMSAARLLIFAVVIFAQHAHRR